MKHNKHPKDYKKVGALRQSPNGHISEIPIDFVPPVDEISRDAYLIYLNQGSIPGQDVKHWLEAEARLLAEHNLNHSGSALI